MTLIDQEQQNNLLLLLLLFWLSSSGHLQFFFQGRDKHNFEFATAAEEALLSIAAA